MYRPSELVIPAVGRLRICDGNALRRFLSVASNAGVFIFPWDPVAQGLSVGWRVQPNSPEADPRIITHGYHGCIVEWEWWVSGGAGTVISIIQGTREGV
mgnify:CR=1 FL=1